VALQSALPDKLLNPPRGGGNLKEKSGFRSAERCLRSLSKQIPAIETKTLAEDTIFIGKSDRLLGAQKRRTLERCDRVASPWRWTGNFFGAISFFLRSGDLWFLSSGFA